MGIITRMRKDKAVYWPPPGSARKFDKYGIPLLADPVEIDVRWEDVSEEFLDSNGTRQMSKALVFVDRDVALGGKLLFGPKPAGLIGTDSVVISPSDISTGLVAHYRMNDLLGVDETPNNHTAGVVGTPTIAPGQIGNANFLDGVGDYYSTPYHVDFELPHTGGSVMCWFNIDPTFVYTGNTQRHGLLRRNAHSNTNVLGSYGMNIYRANPSVPATIRGVLGNGAFGGTVDILDGTTDLQLSQGTWHHGCMTWNATTINIYLDGVLENSATRLATNLTYSDNMPFTFGRSCCGSGYTFPNFFGGFQECRVYNRELTPAEVSILANPSIPNNVPISIPLAYPLSGETNLVVEFDGSKSFDPDGAIVAYKWEFGDGSPDGSGAVVSHTYTTPGTYTVKLTATDDSSNEDISTLQITANIPPVNEPPKAVLQSSAQSGELPLVINFDGTLSSDPDGNINDYAWDFGDGTPVVFGAIVSHTYTTVGPHVVTLTVTDDHILHEAHEIRRFEKLPNLRNTEILRTVFL